jgi:DNA polymerase III delta subunit
MNLILIHGNAPVAILNAIATIKKNFDPTAIVEVNGKNANFDQVVINLSTPQFFSEKRLVVLENFEEAVDLQKLPSEEELTIVLKVAKALPANSKLLKSALALKAKVQNFSEKDEVSVFPFLDSLAEKNKKSFVQLEELLDKYGSQYVLTMIFFMLRRFIQTPKNLPSFVLQKMEKQKKNFTMEKIKQLYKEGLETDFKIKSGLAEERLALTLYVEKIIL